MSFEKVFGIVNRMSKREGFISVNENRTFWRIETMICVDVEIEL